MGGHGKKNFIDLFFDVSSHLEHSFCLDYLKNVEWFFFYHTYKSQVNMYIYHVYMSDLPFCFFAKLQDGSKLWPWQSVGYYGYDGDNHNLLTANYICPRHNE